MNKLSQLTEKLTAMGVAWVITDGRGRIRDINQPFVDMCGYSREELFGRKPRELLQGPLTETGRLELLSNYLWNRLPIATQLTNYRKNGDPYEVHLAIFPLKTPVTEEFPEPGFFAIEYEVCDDSPISREMRDIVYNVAQALIS